MTVKTAVSKVDNKTQQKKILKMQPAADIYESKEGVTVYVDLPGVPQENLDIQIDKNILTIEGEVNLNTPDDLEATYMDVQANLFSRQFTLSSELAVDKVDANLENGVLSLSIPRSAQHKPRKIKVKVG